MTVANETIASAGTRARPNHEAAALLHENDSLKTPKLFASEPSRNQDADNGECDGPMALGNRKESGCPNDMPDETIDTRPTIERQPKPASAKAVHVKGVPDEIWRRARQNALTSGMPFKEFVIHLLSISTPI